MSLFITPQSFHRTKWYTLSNPSGWFNYSEILIPNSSSFTDSFNESIEQVSRFREFDVDDCSTALAVSLPGIMIININISNINALHCDCVESTNTHLGSAKSVFLNSCFPFPELADKQLETNSLPHTISWETKINHMAAMAFAPEIFYHYLSTCTD